MKRSEQGFSLVEILVALLIFSIVVVGTITVIGAATAGGFVDVFPTAFAATRAARDYTAASTYLQALEEFAASQEFAAATVGTYCVEGPAVGSGCTSPNPLPWGPLTPAGPTPAPPAAPFQLAWDKLEVVIEQWYWDDSNADPALRKYRYCVVGTPGCQATADSVKLVRATLTWIFKDETTTLCWGDSAPTPQRSGRCLTVKRFLRSSP